MVQKHRLYALQHYTELGDLNSPPVMIYVLIFLSRTWGLLVISLTSSQTGEKILQLFYPDKSHFYLGLVVGLLPLLIFFISGRRHAQSTWALKYWWVCFYLLLLAVFSDIIMQLYYLYLIGFKYTMSASIQLVIIMWIGIYILKSKHLRDAYR
jgi:hypothetical protein